MPMYQPPRWQPPRKHGLQLPLSRDQLGAMIFYPILATAFYLICGFYLPKQYLPLVLGLYTACVVVAVACWFYVSLTDPSQPGGIPCWCMKQTQGHSRYCASCRKSVPGLDHHCLWLNTCIGTRNYFFFFTLAVVGTLQFALQAAVSVLLLTHWLHRAPSVERAIKATVGSHKAYQAFMILHAVAASIAFLSFASLCVFHSYLQAVGLGTYDWILSKRAPTTATVAVPPARPAPATYPPPAAVASSRSSNSSAPAAPAAAPPASAVNGGAGAAAADVGGKAGGEHVAVTIPPPSFSSYSSSSSSSSSAPGPAAGGAGAGAGEAAATAAAGAGAGAEAARSIEMVGGPVPGGQGDGNGNGGGVAAGTGAV